MDEYRLPLVDKHIAAVGLGSQRTASTYKSALTLYGTFCTENELPVLATDSMIAFYDHLESVYEPYTSRTYMSALRSYLTYLRANDYDLSVNFDAIAWHLKHGRPAYDHAKIEELTPVRMEQIPILVRHYGDGYELPEKDSYGRMLTAMRDRVVFWLLYDTGARIGEIAQLDRSHFNASLQGHPSRVIGKGSHGHDLHWGKNSKRYCRAYLTERRDTGDALLVAHSRNANGNRLSATTISTTIRTIMNSLGINRQLSAHDIRHFRAQQLYNNGVPLSVIQKYLNHASLETTRRYYAPDTPQDMIDKHLASVPYPD